MQAPTTAPRPLTDPTQANGCNQYGASLGRTCGNGTPTGPVRLFRVKLDRQGYDHGGAYWGVGLPLYCATDGNDFTKYARAATRKEAATALLPTAPAFPALAEWHTYYNSEKYSSYGIEIEGVKYDIMPLLTHAGKLRGYSLTAFGFPQYGHVKIDADGDFSPANGYFPDYRRAASAAKAARLAHAKRPQT